VWEADSVLQKIYHRNAASLMKGLDSSGFPNQAAPSVGSACNDATTRARANAGADAASYCMSTCYVL